MRLNPRSQKLGLKQTLGQFSPSQTQMPLSCESVCAKSSLLSTTVLKFMLRPATTICYPRMHQLEHTQTYTPIPLLYNIHTHTGHTKSHPCASQLVEQLHGHPGTNPASKWSGWFVSCNADLLNMTLLC